jgi:hypothetical protein
MPEARLALPVRHPFAPVRVVDEAHLALEGVIYI